MTTRRRNKTPIATRLMVQHCACPEPDDYDVMCTCCLRLFDAEVLNELVTMPFPRLAEDVDG